MQKKINKKGIALTAIISTTKLHVVIIIWLMAYEYVIKPNEL